MCLHCVCKVSECFSRSCDTSWFPHICTIWALSKPLLRSKVSNKWLSSKHCNIGKKIFFWNQTSSCKCSISVHCVRKVSECFSRSCDTSWFPCICTIWALSKPLLRSKVSNKWLSSKRCNIGKKIFFWNQTSSCKRSMCVDCVCKVSECFSRRCDTSWFPRICTIWALSKPLLRSKVSNKWLSSKRCNFS